MDNFALGVVTAAGVIKVVTLIKTALARFGLVLDGHGAAALAFIVTLGWKVLELVFNPTETGITLNVILGILPSVFAIWIGAAGFYGAAAQGVLGTTVKNITTRPVL